MVMVEFRKVIVFTGVVETPRGRVESYQLLIDREYMTAVFDGSAGRAAFLDDVSDAFVGRLLDIQYPFVLGVYNGLRINPETNRNERIPQLEESKVDEFSVSVREKMKLYTMPVTSMN
jgi:hypothetical protein